MGETGPGREPFEVQIPPEVRQHFRSARKEIRAGIKALLPPAAVEHGLKARKEMLLAWRGMIDAALARLEQDNED
jgi:hypothetical protein